MFQMPNSKYVKVLNYTLIIKLKLDLLHINNIEKILTSDLDMSFF